MKEINLNVDGMTLKPQETYKGIVRGTDNYLVLRFVFIDRTWKNRRKVAHMEDVEGNSYNCIVGKDNRVKVPASVTGTSRLFVKLYGKEGTTTVSTNTITIEQE